MGILIVLVLPLLVWTLELKSPSFEHGGIIPVTYTCDGKNISPPLLWNGVPQSAKSLVLIMHDPDAPARDFTHWIVYSIPPTVGGLPRAFPKKAVTSHGIKQGLNDFGFIGYAGPCPPPWDSFHRYRFELYALDYEPNLPAGATKKEVERAIRGHILAKATLEGKYKRTKPFKFAKLIKPIVSSY